MIVSLTALVYAAPPPIVGGEPLSEGARPEVAAVYIGDDVGCTGVLVAPDTVLTAGHCFAATAVRLDVADHSLEGGERYAVAEVVLHPDGDEVTDLALLRLDGLSDIPPAALASGCVIDEALYDGAAVALVGYGYTDRYGTLPTTLLHEAETVVADHDCDSLDRGCREAISPGGELIAGGEGVDTCIGDSGGPVYLETPWGEAVVGITSRAVTDATAFCEGGGIYVRPDAAIAWLEEVTGVDFVEPECPPPDTGMDTGVGGKDEPCGCISAGDSTIDSAALWLLVFLGLWRRVRG